MKFKLPQRKKVMVEVPINVNGAKMGVQFNYQIGKSIMKAKFMGFSESANVEYCMNTLKFVPENDAYMLQQIVQKMLVATK